MKEGRKEGGKMKEGWKTREGKSNKKMEGGRENGGRKIKVERKKDGGGGEDM
jgi:hypothetical protein